MPTHLYIPREPTPIIDRLRAHAFEFTVSLSSAVCGALLIVIAHHLDRIMATSSLSQLDPILVYCIGGFFTVGGVTALYGVLVRRDNIRRELNIEQMGFLILTFGWLAYTVPTALYGITSIFGVILGTGFTLGCALRFDALRKIEDKLVASIHGPEGDGADHGTDI